MELFNGGELSKTIVQSACVKTFFFFFFHLDRLKTPNMERRKTNKLTNEICNHIIVADVDFRLKNKLRIQHRFSLDLMAATARPLSK